MHSQIDQFVISNPKRYSDDRRLEKRLFPYYAGYSESFTRALLSSAMLDPESTTLDPWSGAGTTVRALREISRKGIGVDLNPAMVIVAKASLLARDEEPSLMPLALSIASESRRKNGNDRQSVADPLEEWLIPESVSYIRTIEVCVNRTFISSEKYLELTASEALLSVSPIAAFFYVALFRAVRRLLQDFVPTNPTWVKSPGSQYQRKRPSRVAIEEAFLGEVERLKGTPAQLAAHDDSAEVTVRLGSSEKLELDSASIDFVVGSPPYCTRIDYAVATAIELAVLRYSTSAFDALRRSLIGTSTVPMKSGSARRAWGAESATFLARLKSHPSKASHSYYFKNHVQYFSSMYASVSEISRVLRPSGTCVLVVQDSHYKELHNDVPKIIVQMGANCGLHLRRKESFLANRSMVRLNTRAIKYLTTRTNVESVLCFERE